MATIRFRELVKKAGKPEAKSLWMDPKHDAQFTRAIQQHRVLTVVQEPGHKDFGEIGFHQQPHASYFVFPRPLGTHQGVRVVGIKYDVVEQPEIKDPLSSEVLEKSARAKPPNRGKIQNRALPEKSFNVLVRRIAVIKASVPIIARNKAEAKKKAVEITKSQPFDPSKAVFRTEAP